MGEVKSLARKKRLIKKGKKKTPPIWANIKKYGLKRIRTRRIRVTIKKWKESSKLKV